MKKGKSARATVARRFTTIVAENKFRKNSNNEFFSLIKANLLVLKQFWNWNQATTKAMILYLFVFLTKVLNVYFGWEKKKYSFKQWKTSCFQPNTMVTKAKRRCGGVNSQTASSSASIHDDDDGMMMMIEVVDRYLTELKNWWSWWGGERKDTHGG